MWHSFGPPLSSRSSSRAAGSWLIERRRGHLIFLLRHFAVSIGMAMSLAFSMRNVLRREHAVGPSSQFARNRPCVISCARRAQYIRLVTGVFEGDLSRRGEIPDIPGHGGQATTVAY